jgi:threonine/homoserine/homoserine lactone efflux protein
MVTGAAAMNWSTYVSFLVFAGVLTLVPGPDVAVVTRNTLSAGRRRGWWSAVGVASACAVQGAVAAAGLGALLLRVEPLFQAVRWAGIAYLVVLGMQSLRSAVAGRYPDIDAVAVPRGQALAGWRQGFLTNIANPKVLVFYLAVLPQFLGRGAPVGVVVLFALSHAVLGLLYLSGLVAALHRARRLLSRRAVRRALDAVTGTALIGFGARLATERA